MGAIRQLGIFAVLAIVLLPPASARELHSYAFIGDDATLTINHKQIHLYGIHIPRTHETCQTTIRPVTCTPGAALALDFKIQGFVRCEILAKYPDRSLTGRCYYKDEDLSAYLLSQGWALALPNAPVAYQSLERIAQHHRLGIWSAPNINVRDLD